MDDRRTSVAPSKKRPAAARRSPHDRPPFDCIALLLQGGGALGAYQGGVYQGLAEAGLHPDWVAGISIGAINAALIAGNPPELRVEKLRRFWESITSESPWDPLCRPNPNFGLGDEALGFLGQASAARALIGGVSGFFTPRMPAPWFQASGSLGATSYYDTRPLKATLESLVDFDRINADKMGFSVGAVNVRSGNFIYFDSAHYKIGPEHILASGSLPPGFPAIEIEGEYYWDGGLVSNTPLQWVLQYGPRQDTLTFQVDLWNARGDFPRNIAEVATRQKEITYSSRTRDNTDHFKDLQKVRHAVADLLDALPKNLKGLPAADILNSFGDRSVYNIVHLIYRAQHYEGDSKDHEFSRRSMERHWLAGYHDTIRTLRHPDVLKRPTNPEGLAVYDFTKG